MKLSDGRLVQINLYTIQKGLDKQLGLYWYRAHGRIVASEYWGKFYVIYDALRLNRTDAMIRIGLPIVEANEDLVRTQAIAFAQRFSRARYAADACIPSRPTVAGAPGENPQHPAETNWFRAAERSGSSFAASDLRTVSIGTYRF